MQTSGLFDLQVNGFAGVDFNDAGLTPDAFDIALQAMLATGVTQALPTLITASADLLAARFEALDTAVRQSKLGPLMVPGYHLEGPFLNPAPGFRGCHPPGVMIAPDIALVDRLRARLSKPMLLVTLAPELDGAVPFIAALRARGIAVAMGHSDARLPAVNGAAATGLTLATHLGNGVAHMMHKFDNPLFAQLADDRIAACFIADGIHVAPHALQIMMRAKGLDRCILVTDAVAAAAAAPGLYPFAGMTIERSADGSVREPGAPMLAGSSLTLDQAVRNVVDWGLCSLGQAVAMAAGHPRAAIASATLANIPSGEIEWDEEHRIVRTRIDGRTLFATN